MHGLLKDPKAILGKFVAVNLGQIKAMAITYAYAKLDEIYQKLLNTCPPPEVLEKLIKTLATLKKVVGKYKTSFQKFEPLPKKLEIATIAGKAIVEIFGHNPVPVTIGIPPPYGGVLVSFPAGFIQSSSNFLVWTRKTVEILETEAKDITVMLSDAKNILDPITERILMLEALIQRCIQAQAEGGNLTKEELDALRKASTGLDKGLRTGVVEGESYTASNGTTYTILVLDDPNSPSVAPRRQAVAKDYRDIIVLKGPLSFAGDEQVLKDELKFQIEFLTSQSGTLTGNQSYSQEDAANLSGNTLEAAMKSLDNLTDSLNKGASKFADETSRYEKSADEMKIAALAEIDKLKESLKSKKEKRKDKREERKEKREERKEKRKERREDRKERRQDRREDRKERREERRKKRRG